MPALRRWEPGDLPTMARMNQTVDAINVLTEGLELPQQRGGFRRKRKGMTAGGNVDLNVKVVGLTDIRRGGAPNFPRLVPCTMVELELRERPSGAIDWYITDRLIDGVFSPRLEAVTFELSYLLGTLNVFLGDINAASHRITLNAQFNRTLGTYVCLGNNT